MENWVPLAVAIAAYLLGGFSPGYWLVRWRTGRDVREHGSGGTGATNVGRVLGRGGYALVMALDALKGAVAVFAAQQLQLGATWIYAAALLVVMGHIWPAQLGFRGGRGVATLLGVWLMLSPLVLAPCLALGLIALAALRRFTLAGLCGLTLLPVSAWWWLRTPAAVAMATAMLAVVLFAHRDHLRRWLHPDSAAST